MASETDVKNPSWKEISAKKREQLSASIPTEWRIPINLLPPESQDDLTTWPETSGWFTQEELAITNSSATELIPDLALGKLKSEVVIKAFCKRAVAAHQLTNCLSEICFDRAFVTARNLDEHLQRTGKPIGPLHGLPISLKDNFKIKGLDATVGFTSHVGDPATSESALTELLEAAGAIIYVKTNVPTAMMIAETVNNTFGPTLNPRNKKTTCGGSSGGEAALIAMKGSCIGVGSDIGGSLRIPAACTGLFTIRPSAGRFPVRNTRSGLPGQEAVLSVNGPLARTLEEIELYSKSVVEEEPWLRDPKCIPIPWRTVELPAKLKIAVMWNDGVVRPTPPVRRALDAVVKKLKASNYEIIDWDPIDQAKASDLLQRMFVADGGKAVQKELDRTGEPWRPEMKTYEEATELGTSDMWNLHLERTEYQNRYLDRWNEAGIDAIICPTTPFSTTKVGTFKYVGYTGVYNVLDYSSVSFPTGIYVDKSVDRANPTEEPLSKACKGVSEEYDADLVDGYPISLQLVARRLEEEKVLAMVKRVLTTIG